MRLRGLASPFNASANVCRVLRLTLLAPDIAERILDGRQLEAATLPALMKGFPIEWDRQP
ncbi:hypothetical protein E4O86_02655 [Rhizobiales bacterium L72]|uniref:Uncharacterized protein n=1 Tax=Propylenella binzhouense TaxID=2555902 RepID=A0A964T1H0_9HYPH|nr:hypothetical protein [Propylenella binzhouense]